MKIAGTAYFLIDGKQYLLRGNMKISLGMYERESVIGQDKYHGVKEMPAAPYIECDLTDTPDIDINVLENLTNVTVTFELINGKSGVLRNATQMNKIELDAGEGQMTVRFEGPTGEWSTAA